MLTYCAFSWLVVDWCWWALHISYQYRYILWDILLIVGVCLPSQLPSHLPFGHCSTTKIFDNISFGVGFHLLGFYFPDYEKRNAVMSVGIIATHLCNSCKFHTPQNVNFLLISHPNGLFLCKYHFISYTEELEWISDLKNDIFVYRLIWQHNITP